tara:strand:- start:121 stop:672 length:552 start_codon:yes stop_codon:yes gene_type:complete
MKKLILLIQILFSTLQFICQENYIKYESKDMKFYYPDSYEISEKRIMYDINVKLMSKKPNYDGTTDNIGIVLNSLFSKIAEINKENYTLDWKRKVYEDFKKAGINNVSPNELSFEKKIIQNKEVMVRDIHILLMDYNISSYQREYIFIQNNKTCFIINTGSSIDELNLKELEIKEIINSLEIF